MLYQETNVNGYAQIDMSFQGFEEAILAYRGALFSGDTLLTQRLERQMHHVLSEWGDTEHNIYPEVGLYYMDRDAKLIIDGLRKQIQPNNTQTTTEYVHPDRAVQIRFMLEQAGVSLDVQKQTTPVLEKNKQLIPRPRTAAAEVAA